MATQSGGTQCFEIGIIGGGVYGCAIAYHLSHWTRGVALFERGAIGAEGATRYSGGIVRVYDPDPLLSELALLGATAFASWEATALPGASPMSADGCLYLAAPDHADHAARAAARFDCQDYPIEVIEARDLTQRFRFLRPGHPGIGVFERYGGVGDPRLTARNLAAGARRNHVALFEHCPVESIRFDARGYWSLALRHGRVRCDRLVIAAGAYAGALAPAMSLSVQSIALTQLYVEGGDIGIPVIDECTETYVRPIGGRNLLCGSQVRTTVEHPEKLPPYGSGHAEDSYRRAAQLLHPDLRLSVVAGVAGFDGYTPDCRPKIGFVDAQRSLYLAVGFSGRGYKYVLPVSEAIAREVVGHSSGLIDLAPFRPETFDTPRVAAGGG